MIDIYINYYTVGNELIQNEKLLYSIPISANDENVLNDPVVKTEMGKTGSFEFSVNVNHPYYNCWNQMKTMLRVVYFGETIFYGRVLTIDIDHLTGKKQIHCEGYLAFLMDSQVEGKAEADRSVIAASTYISNLISNHNSQMSASIPNKRFELGMLPGNWGSARSEQRVKTEKSRFGTSSWQDTSSAFSSLINTYGGYLRTRYDNGKVYLDWLNNYFNYGVNSRIIEVANNVISLNSSAEVDNIFTVLVPIGKKTNENSNSDALYLNPKELYVKDIGKHFSESELNTTYQNLSDYENSLKQYGIIYKVVSFSNADSESTLEEWAWDYIKTNYHGGLTSFNATAVDLKILDDSKSPLLAGDRVLVKYPDGEGGTRSKELTIISAELDLHSPSNNIYTIGIPDNAINREYGDSSKKSSSKGGGGGNIGGGGGPRNIEDDPPGGDPKVDHFFGTHVLMASSDDSYYQDYANKYGEKAASSILKTSEMVLTGAIDEVGTNIDGKKKRLWGMVIDGVDGSINIANPNGLSKINSIFAKESDAEWESYQKAVTSLSLTASETAMTVKERFDFVADMKEEQRKQALLKGPRTVLEVAIQEAKDGVDILGRSARIQSWVAGTPTSDGALPEPDLSLVQDGTTGSFFGLNLGLSGKAGEAVQKMVDKIPGFSSNVSLSGIDSSIKVSPDNNKTTLEIDGKGNENTGTISVGKEQSGWLVQVNKPLQYRIDGVLHTVPNGTIDASDYAALQKSDPIPSIRAQIASFKTVLADVVHTGQLTAIEGYINTLTTKVGNIERITSKAITTDTLNSSFSVGGSMSISNLLQINGGASLSVNGTLKYHGTAISLNGITVVTNADTGTTRSFSYLGTAAR